MDELETKLGSILGNPEMMEKIMALAQNMGQTAQKNDTPPPVPDIDISMIQKLSGLAGQSNIDKNQHTLLNALRPYVNAARINKLERAMRAAKMAGMAGILTGKNAMGR